MKNNGLLAQIWSASTGTYTLSFQAAQRGSGNDSAQQLRVTLRPSGSAISTKTLLWCGNQICEERDSTGANTTKRFFTEGEQRIGIGAGSYYYSRDHLGSIREVTGSNGAVKGRYDYDAWGNQTASEGKVTADFGYTGHYFHQPSGMNLAMYRAYSPSLGRWLSRDPIDVVSRSAIAPELLPDGPNLYRYVANNVIGNVDLLGLQSCDCTGKNGSPLLLSDCWTQPSKALQRQGWNVWQTACLLAQEACEVCCGTCFAKDLYGRCPRFCATQYLMCIRGGGEGPRPPNPMPQPQHPPRPPHSGSPTY